MATPGKWLNLAIGAVLLCVGGYFLVHLSTWTPPWKMAAKPVATAPKAETSNPDDPTDAARLKAYGVLADEMNREQATDSGNDNPEEKPRTVVKSDAAIDHSQAAAASEKHFLHKTFSVKDYEGFEFIVPAHAFQPRVKGTFKAFGPGGGQAAVDIMLLDESQLKVFLQGLPSGVTDSVEGQRAGEVEWSLNSPLAGDAKYYLVFRPSPTPKQGRRVQADFTFTSD